MDSFTERMLERASARKKKLEAYYSEAKETIKIPLKEPNEIRKKYENFTKSQPDLSESNKLKRKEVVSDSNLNMKSSNFYDSSMKENLSDSNIRKGCTIVSSDLQSSPQTPTKTLNIQKENFNMEIKLTSLDNVRVEVEIEEREEDFTDEEGNDASGDNVKGLYTKHSNEDDNDGEEVMKGIRRIQKDKIEESDDKPAIRAGVKNRLQRLGKLYSGDAELSSPIQRTEAKFCEDEIPDRDVKKPATGALGRLKALASTRNQWEDEITTPSNKVATKETPKKSWKPPAPKPPAATAPTFTPMPKKGVAPKPPTNGAMSAKVTAKLPSRESTPERSKIASPRNSPMKDRPTAGNTKQMAWDNAVLATLESQGFTRTNSKSKLVYNYDKKSETSRQQPTEEDIDEMEEEEACNVKDTKKVSKLNVELKDTHITEENEPESEEDVHQIPEPQIKPTQSESKISKMASRFGEQKSLDVEEKKMAKPPSKTNLRTGDVLSRAAMFEKSPSKNKNVKDPALMSVSERKALFEKNKGSALIPKAAFGMPAPIKKNNADKDTVASKPAAVKPDSPHKSAIHKPTTQHKVPVFKTPVSPAKPAAVMSPTKAYIAESGGIASKMRALLEKKSTISQNQIVNSIQEQRQKDLDLLLNRFNKNRDVPQDENEIEEDGSSDDEYVSETTKMIAERTAKVVQFKEKEMPPPPVVHLTPPHKSSAPKRRSKGDSPKVREVLDEVKRIKVIQPKSGRMYPCLSDIEACTETDQEEEVPTTADPSPDTSYEDNESSYADSEEPNTSFGREILDVVCKNQTPQKRPILDDDTASDLSDILDDMDDYLDEAMGREDSDCTEGPTPPKQGRSTPPRNTAAPSNSFHYSKGSPAKYGPPQLEPRSPIRKPAALPKSPARPTIPSTINYTPKKSIDLPTHVVDDGNVLPLTHTVSFYRKQQAQGSRTPVRQISRQPALQELSPEREEPDETEEVREKIQELMNVVAKQQIVISQASQALNLCCSTIEFSGSSEQVEAERLLLVASQRRQAALHEVQRLRVEGTLHPGGGGAQVEKATLIISDITLPLKKEYVRALSAAGGKGHHVVCLVRLAEHVIPTRLVSTVASPRDAPELNLRIPSSVRLKNIYSDFTVTVEVYSLQAQEELLPHEVKYHIHIKKGGKMTPKKLKQESKLVMPAVQSPAGPQAVRSPSFALMGYVVFSLQGINRKHWTLNNAPAMSVLEGSVQMRVSCEFAVSVEHRGFLTMFDDVSGFGAWHRRWCLLKGHMLSYWKYPDDERKKAPIDSLNLQIISTKKVGQVSRDICARPHTFLLETVRAARSDDTDTLVTVCQGDKTIIRHLLSADTKQERIEWCENFNKSLDILRMWGGNSKK